MHHTHHLLTYLLTAMKSVAKDHGRILSAPSAADGEDEEAAICIDEIMELLTTNNTAPAINIYHPDEPVRDDALLLREEESDLL